MVSTYQLTQRLTFWLWISLIFIAAAWVALGVTTARTAHVVTGTVVAVHRAAGLYWYRTGFYGNEITLQLPAGTFTVKTLDNPVAVGSTYRARYSSVTGIPLDGHGNLDITYYVALAFALGSAVLLVFFLISYSNGRLDTWYNMLHGLLDSISPPAGRARRR